MCLALKFTLYKQLPTGTNLHDFVSVQKVPRTEPYRKLLRIANMKQVCNYTSYREDLGSLQLVLCVKCEQEGNCDTIMMTCQLQFVEPQL
jgi:hypothetical protein